MNYQISGQWQKIKRKILWIASRTADDDLALSYFNTSTRKITKVSLGKSFTENEVIKALFIDSAGFLWMSTYRGFYFYNTNDSTGEYYIVGPRTILAPYYGDPEKMWLSTIDGIFLFSLKTRKRKKYLHFHMITKAIQQLQYLSYTWMPQTTRLFTLVQNFMEWEFTTRRKIL
jgi:hypothetical protein